MTLTINGVDITPYIAPKGIKWQRQDVDGPAAGRMLDASMTRSRIAIKRRVDVTCRPLTTAEAGIVLSAIAPEFVTVAYTDPMAGGDVTKTMYSNNIPATIATIVDGTELWDGIVFPLIEK